MSLQSKIQEVANRAQEKAKKETLYHLSELLRIEAAQRGISIRKCSEYADFFKMTAFGTYYFELYSDGKIVHKEYQDEAVCGYTQTTFEGKEGWEDFFKHLGTTFDVFEPIRESLEFFRIEKNATTVVATYQISVQPEGEKFRVYLHKDDKSVSVLTTNTEMIATILDMTVNPYVVVGSMVDGNPIIFVTKDYVLTKNERGNPKLFTMDTFCSDTRAFRDSEGNLHHVTKEE